jgi:hypothetical protein
VAKRRVILTEVKTLIEQGTFDAKSENQGWIFHRFDDRGDNLICAAVVMSQALIIKTAMVNWRVRGAL